MNRTVTVMYSCKSCGTWDREVQVRARNKDEEIRTWVEAVRDAVSRDHNRHFRMCSSTVCDLKLPLNGTGRVGDAVNH